MEDLIVFRVVTALSKARHFTVGMCFNGIKHEERRSGISLTCKQRVSALRRVMRAMRRIGY